MQQVMKVEEERRLDLRSAELLQSVVCSGNHYQRNGSSTTWQRLHFSVA